MAKTQRNSQIKRDRRNLLANLRMVYPGWMDGEELYLTLVDANPELHRRDLVKDLAYFAEKKYLEFRGIEEDRRNPAVEGCRFKLTALGTEVADQIRDDPMLEV